MRPGRREFAAALYAESHAFDERQTDRLVRWRNVEPETAELLGVLARALGARRVAGDRDLQRLFDALAR